MLLDRPKGAIFRLKPSLMVRRRAATAGRGLLNTNKESPGLFLIRITQRQQDDVHTLLYQSQEWRFFDEGEVEI